MALFPKDGSETVVVCNAGQLVVYLRSEWDKPVNDPEPLLQLTKDESRAIAWLLGHWLGEHTLRPGYNLPLGAIDAKYE